MQLVDAIDYGIQYGRLSVAPQDESNRLRTWIFQYYSGYSVSFSLDGLHQAQSKILIHLQYLPTVK